MRQRYIYGNVMTGVRIARASVTCQSVSPGARPGWQDQAHGRMRATNRHFMLYVAGVAAVGVVIVTLFMRTGPTRDQMRADSATVQPMTTVSGRP